MWNLEKQYYLQGRNRDADVENRLVDTEREGTGGTDWESSPENGKSQNHTETARHIC